MRRIIAGLFAICAATAAAGCSFDPSGAPADPTPDAATPDAGVFDAMPGPPMPPMPPDACMGKKCDGGKGPGPGPGDGG